MRHHGEVGGIKHLDKRLFAVKHIDKALVVRVDRRRIGEKTVALAGHRTAAEGKNQIAVAVIFIDKTGVRQGKYRAVRPGSRVHKIPGVLHKGARRQDVDARKVIFLQAVFLLCEMGLRFGIVFVRLGDGVDEVFLIDVEVLNGAGTAHQLILLHLVREQ